MNLRQLEAFRATIRCGSVTAAAREMNLSQPSVSRLLAGLEESAGFPLFARAGRGLEPTEEGLAFFEGVESMYVGIERMRELAKTILAARGGTIVVGTIQSVAAIEFPRAVARIYRERPDARFIMHSRNTPAIVEAVRMREFDLGVVGRESAHEGVDILHRTSAPYVCLMPEDHPLADEYGPVDLEQIAGRETFATFGQTYPDEMMSMAPALSERLRERSRLTVANVPLATALVREAGVLAVADPFSAEQAVRMGGVVFRPVKQALTYHVSVIAAARGRVPPQALEFAEILAAGLDERVAQVKALGGG